MRYLTVDELVAINAAEVGSGNVRDRGLAESAVLRPQQTVIGEDAYPDIHAKAAALLHSIVSNHPFVDGNKRAGLLAVVLFYRLNGWQWNASQEEAYDLVMAVTEGRLSEVGEIASHLQAYAFEG